MNTSDLRERARSLLEAQLLPGIDQDKINGSIQELGTIVTRLHHRADPTSRAAREAIIERCRDVYDRGERLLLGNLPSARVRAGVRETLTRLEEILADTHAHPGNVQRYIVSTQQAASTLEQLGLRPTRFTHIPYATITAHAEHKEELISAAKGHRVTLRPEKRYHVAPAHARTADDLWNLSLIGAPAAWNSSRGEGIKVGVVDTGCDYTHPEIANRFGQEKGYDFVNNEEDPRDDNGHGTHVAGTVAGFDVGVAPGVQLYALKFLDANGSGYETDFIRAAEWAIDKGLHVINGSFGSPQYSPAERAICQALEANGILFAAAAGNAGTTQKEYPASYDSVISVAAVNQAKQRAPFSQVNECVELAAPGVDVVSCVPGGYDSYSGTSMATPHVAGALALIGAHESRTRLQRTAEDLGPSEEYGYGLVRVDAAVRSVRRRMRG